MKKEHKEIIETLLNEIDQETLEMFGTTKYDELICYHSTLGMHIRNRFKLWEVSWEPELDEEGVDCSPLHPDAISMEIIKELWRRLHERLE